MLKRWSWVAIALIMMSSGASFSARAEEESADSEAGLDLTLRTAAAAMPAKTADGSALESDASHIYLMDENTGSVLIDKAGDMKMYPSSMTKIMTLYVLFDRLKQGALALDSQFSVSEKAWRMQGSKMFVELGSQIGLEDLIRGIAIQSGNDACIVVAEGIAGSEDAFAKQMNDTAKKLGMTNSNFVDASGWPNPNHTTTAHDLALLGSSLIRDFPEYYHYLSEREFTYHGIRQFNRNLLLGNPSLKVDGMKTGHTEAAGYGITLSAVDPASKRRLVLVLNGLGSEAARAQEGERLLKWGFANFSNVVAFAPTKEIVKAPVWMGGVKEVALTVAAPVEVTKPKTGNSAVKASVSYNAPLLAPLTAGQEVGKLTLTDVNGAVREFPLVTAEAVGKLGFFARIPRALGL